MKSLFTFHGIGQGLFYSGTIKHENQENAFNFVYDCGSESLEKLGEPTLQVEEIDFIAISHFHKDHINGIPKLLEKYHVKKIYIPYFDARTYKNVFISKLISSDIFPSSPEFHMLLYWYGCDDELSEYLTDRHRDYYTSIPVQSVGRDAPTFNTERNRWTFHFYNRHIPDNELDDIDKKIKAIIGKQTIEEYIRSQKGFDFNNIAKQFRSVFSYKQNLTSLVLMHWSEDNPSIKTLLTGDVRFDDDLSRRVINDISETDSIKLQIPHHGAAKEWDSIDTRIINQASDYIISFGKTNGYHHPNIGKIIEYYIAKRMDKVRFVFDKTDYIYDI